MTVRAYRLTRTARLSSALSGEGAARYGGRWNSEGTPVVYASGSLSLAMLEIMVHLEDYGTLLDSYSFVLIEIPADRITVVHRKPPGWNANPPGIASQRVGDTWTVRLTSVALSVPSVLAPEERNYLLNPRHPDFRKIRFGKPRKLPFDPRLIKG